MTTKSAYEDSGAASSSPGAEPGPSAYRPGKRPTARPGREGGKRASNRDARVAALCGAALGLFSQRGVAAVSVDEITRAAGVAKGSFYRYFEDKEQLVAALFAPMAAQLRAALDACHEALDRASTGAELVAAYQRLGLTLVPLLTSEPRLILLYLRERRTADRGSVVRALGEEVTARAVSLTEVAHRHGLLRPLPAEVTAVAVIGAVEGLVFRWLERGAEAERPAPMDSDAERGAMADALVSMVLDGLRAP